MKKLITGWKQKYSKYSGVTWITGFPALYSYCTKRKVHKGYLCL